MKSYQRSVDLYSPQSQLALVEGKSVPTTPFRKRIRRRFGYLAAVSLIAVGTLLNLQLVIPTLALASLVSLSVVGIAVLIQMPVRFLEWRKTPWQAVRADGEATQI
ncbi:MAG: hypothetical protein KDB27_15935 [Planctomycetales bacterium]|nr:hypothetical protein [Planctomycetales bacterium]